MRILQKLSEDLPPEPGRALVEFVDRIFRKKNTSSGLSGNAEDYHAIVKFIIKFSKKYNLKIDYSEIRIAKDDHEYDILMKYINYTNTNRAMILKNSVERETDDVISQYDGYIDEHSFGMARLNSNEKRKIHEYLERIRLIIEGSDIADRKKNALFERINQLSAEVDAHGTRTDRFFAFAGDLAFVIGDMAEKAKPMLDEVRSMIRVLSRSRARLEGVSLPPGDEPLQLPQPENDSDN